MKSRIIFVSVIAMLFALVAYAQQPPTSSGKCSGYVACLFGGSTIPSVALQTDAGTVTVDGYVQGAAGPIVSLASGALTANPIHLATATADYAVPTCVAANVGEWVTVVVADASETVSLTLADASNRIEVADAILTAGHELDSPSEDTESGGSFVTLTCLTAELWYSTGIGGVWLDGGAS